jgi:hypothetical protein
MSGFLLFVLFKDFVYFNGNKARKNISTNFKKINNYVIKLPLLQPKKNTNSAVDLRIELENFGTNSE